MGKDWIEENTMSVCQCAMCEEFFLKCALELTYDCHGIPFRYVCHDCYEKIMNDKPYDGEYYTELDECIDYDY